MSVDDGSKPALIVTGSSGFVAFETIPMLLNHFAVIGIDMRPGIFTALQSKISEFSLLERGLQYQDLYVLHLAAARFDYGAIALDYYRDNVTETEHFLACLDPARIKGFVHLSSVAAFDGKHITFHDDLGCDDAYRATKFLQEETVQVWARKHDVPLYLLYPSAIFNKDRRADTNIGKLQSVAKFLPVLVEVPSRKSLTYLPTLSSFIAKCLCMQIEAGQYLTIEQPVLSVTDIVAGLSRRKSIIVKVPFLKEMLSLLAYLLWVLGWGRVDMKLTPNRIKKLFSNTEYDTLPETVDRVSYNADHETMNEILKRVAEANLRND